MVKISLCMVVRNEEERLPELFGNLKPFVSEIVIFDQGSDDKTPDICKAYKAYYHRTTRKDLADIDRQACYNIATGNMVLALDADEHPNDRLMGFLDKVKTEGPEYDVYWFKFKNLIDGVDIKEILGDDWHPRLWVRDDHKPPVIIWPKQAHTFPHINTIKILFCEKGVIVHSRSWSKIRKVHEERRKVIDPQNVGLEAGFQNAVRDLLIRKKGKKYV